MSRENGSKRVRAYINLAYLEGTNIIEHPCTYQMYSYEAMSPMNLWTYMNLPNVQRLFSPRFPPGPGPSPPGGLGSNRTAESWTWYQAVDNQYWGIIWYNNTYIYIIYNNPNKNKTETLFWYIVVFCFHLFGGYSRQISNKQAVHLWDVIFLRASSIA